jgi:hypothetical protein
MLKTSIQVKFLPCTIQEFTPKNANFLTSDAKEKDAGRIRRKLGTTVATSTKVSQFFRT